MIKYERLIELMPRIAEAVNKFHDEVTQRAAFIAILTALGIDTEDLDFMLDDRDLSRKEGS